MDNLFINQAALQSITGMAVAYARDNQEAFKEYADKINPMPPDVREADLTEYFNAIIVQCSVSAALLMDMSAAITESEDEDDDEDEYEDWDEDAEV